MCLNMSLSGYIGENRGFPALISTEPNSSPAFFNAAAGHCTTCVVVKIYELEYENRIATR